MSIITNSSYVLLSNTPDSHRLNQVDFYDIDGNKIHTEPLFENEWGRCIPKRIYNMLDYNFINKIRPTRIVIGPTIKLNYFVSCWFYVYDKNDNCIIHYAFKKPVTSFDQLIKIKIEENCNEGIDWIWVKNNRKKIKFEIHKERKIIKKLKFIIHRLLYIF